MAQPKKPIVEMKPAPGTEHIADERASRATEEAANEASKGRVVRLNTAAIILGGMAERPGLDDDELVNRSIVLADKLIARCLR